MTMNKLVGFGIAVALCMAAAGFGAYMALRPESAVVPVTGAAETGVSAALGAAAVTPSQASPAGVPDAGVAPAPAIPSAPAAESPKPRTAKPGKPAQPADPSNLAVAGAAVPAAPASEVPAAAVSASAGAPPPVETVQPPVAEPVAPQPPPPPQKVLEELVVSSDSVIGLRIESAVNSEVARVEDPVEARVTRDVRVGSEVAIPTGSRVLGSVILVERGGKMKNAARIGVRFHTLVLPDSTRLPMQTEAIYREGKSPGQESAAKVGAAAVGGAILGAIIGGGKGAAIGGSVGAAGGSAAVMAGGRNPAVLTAGTALTVRLSQPVTIIVEREEIRN
jgi:type IV secretory pathway VirB10-like protein